MFAKHGTSSTLAHDPMNPTSSPLHFIACLIWFSASIVLLMRPDDASVHIYDLSTGRKIASLRGHNRPTTAIAVSPDGTLALTASMTAELRWWSLPERRESRVIERLGNRHPAEPGEFRGSAHLLRFVRGTNQVLIGHEYGGLGLWDLGRNFQVRALDAPFREAYTAVVSADEENVIAVGTQGAVAVSWRLADGERRGVFTEEWIENSPWLTLARDGQPRFWWNADTGEVLADGVPLPEGSRMPSRHQATLSPDGQRLLTYYGGVESQPGVHRFRVWDLESGRLLCRRSAITLPIIQGRRTSSCEAFAFSPDSETLAVGTRGGRIEIREVEGGQLKRELSAPANSCDRVAFLPDGKRLVTWGDGRARLWDVETGELVRSFKVPLLYCLTITPDGRFLVIGGGGDFRGL